MQISTRSEDFIIDTFKVWTSLHKLLVVFDDPSITKVLHGADMDIEWL
jgi:exosome complex exonuclease RRP6